VAEKILAIQKRLELSMPRPLLLKIEDHVRVYMVTKTILPSCNIKQVKTKFGGRLTKP
jgi:hypothetical protein